MGNASPRREIERALRFVGENLDRPIGVADVARAARLSEFHFHRVFHAEVGEPVGRYITRRRLELAALRLAYEHDRSITDIALSSGYSSLSNFSKAFQSHFGCSPTRVREPSGQPPASIGKMTALHGRDFRPSDLYVLPPEVSRDERKQVAAHWNQRVRFEQNDGMRFAAMASPGGYDLASVEETWSELIARGRQLGICDEPVDAWGASHDSPQITAPELCRYHACIPCSTEVALPVPLFHDQLHPGRYAVFHYEGEVGGVESAYRSIYSCWFPESSVSPEDFVPFDHYVADEPKDGRVVIEAWFKIRSRR